MLWSDFMRQKRSLYLCYSKRCIFFGGVWLWETHRCFFVVQETKGQGLVRGGRTRGAGSAGRWGAAAVRPPLLGAGAPAAAPAEEPVPALPSGRHPHRSQEHLGRSQAVLCRAAPHTHRRAVRAVSGAQDRLPASLGSLILEIWFSIFLRLYALI